MLTKGVEGSRTMLNIVVDVGMLFGILMDTYSVVNARMPSYHVYLKHIDTHVTLYYETKKMKYDSEMS